MQETQETQYKSLDQEDPLKGKWLPTPVFLPGKFHKQRSLAGHSPRGHKELDTTDLLTYTQGINRIEPTQGFFFDILNDF